MNKYLDMLARPTVVFLNRRWLVFKLCGYAGLLSAIGLTIGLVISQGLSLSVIAGIVLAGIVTFLLLAMMTKIVLGYEELIYYHHEIAIIVVAGLFLWLIDQPILPYLDIAMLGIGAFLIFGRIGCLMVGCCHGRPHRWGVCYRHEHAEAGFSACYVGTRLFPIQLLESITVLFVVLIGSVMVVRGWPAGSALTWYVMSYDIARFIFEFIRGDRGRRYFRGFSEAQWTSLLLMLVVAGLEVAGALPFEWWHMGATGLLGLTFVCVALFRQVNLRKDYRLFLPKHVAEIAEALEVVSGLSDEPPWETNSARQVHIASTSLGLCISVGKIADSSTSFRHYTLSRVGRHLTRTVADDLARLIVQLKHQLCRHELVNAHRSVFHLLVYDSTDDSQFVRHQSESSFKKERRVSDVPV